MVDTNLAPDPINKLTTGAIFVAPVLVAASTVTYAMGGAMNRGEAGGVIQFYAFGVFTIALVGLIGPLRYLLPRTAAVLLATGVLAGISGAGYGIDSIWAAVTEQPQLVDQDLAAGLLAMAPAALLFPMTLIGLGIAYARTGLAAAPAGYLLALSAVMFPAGRATNLLPVALATDVVLLIALVAIGRSLVVRRTAAAQPDANRRPMIHDPASRSGS